MPSYPAGLPCALHQEYGLNHVSPLMRSELESGRARQRRRFTSVPSMANVSWIMTQAQAVLFEGWFKWTINDGADWFDMPLSSPMGVKDYECRFAGMYSGPRLTGRGMWTFSATLEVRERPVIAEDWIEIAPDYILFMDIFDLAMNREWPT